MTGITNLPDEDIDLRNTDADRLVRFRMRDEIARFLIPCPPPEVPLAGSTRDEIVRVLIPCPPPEVPVVGGKGGPPVPPLPMFLGDWGSSFFKAEIADLNSPLNPDVR